MIDYDYVIELNVDVAALNSIVDYYQSATDWLTQHLGDEGPRWCNINVPALANPAIGFKDPSDKRKFVFWSEMQGVPCWEPEVVQVKLSHRWDYVEVHVNL